MALELDRRDLRILEILQTDGRITKAALAERVGLSPTGCWERLRKLQAAGLVRGYRAEIALEALGSFSTFVVQVELENHRAAAFERFEAAIAATPEITRCVAVGGGVDYFLEVVAPDVGRYQRLIDGLLERDLGVRRYFTFVVTKQVKSAGAPLRALLAATPDENPA